MSNDNMVSIPVPCQGYSIQHTNSNILPPETMSACTNMETDQTEPEECINSCVFNIQPDWYLALREENGKTWVTFKERGQLGCHSQIVSEGESGDDQIFNICCEDDFQLSKVTNRSIQITHSKAPGIVFKIIHAEKVFKSIHNKNVSSLDVSAGGLGVSAGDDGSSLFVWETSKGVVRRNLEGHYGDIYSCKLFPSGVVVLSSGADMRIKIWSAEDGSCPVTLTGHTAPVTDTAIVNKGMNIVSTSKDGDVRIWSCGKNKCLEPVIAIEDNLNCCAIQKFDHLPGSVMQASGDTIDREDEVGLEDKILAVGGENGTVSLVNLHLRSVITKLKLPGKNSAVNAISFLAENMLLIGCENGKIICLSIPQLKPLWVFHDSDSSVLSLLSLTRLNGFIAGKLDGSCIFYAINSNKQIADERVLLSGADADPINSIKSDGNYIYTASRDGKIRKYNISHI